MPQSVQLSSVETNTMGLKIDIFLTKTSFRFLIMFHLSRVKLTKWQILCFEPSFTQVREMPAQPYVLGIFYWFYLETVCFTIFHSIIHLFFQFGFKKCMLCKNTTWLSFIYEISIYINKNAIQTLLLNVYSKWFLKLDG